MCLLSPARGGERREILGRWSLLGLQLKNLNEGFNTKKPEIRPFAGVVTIPDANNDSAAIHHCGRYTSSTEEIGGHRSQG